MLPWTNASLHQPPLYARQKPQARSAVVPLEEARSSSLGWEARPKAQRIVTSSSSVRVGAAVLPKSGCLRYWKACGMLQCMSPLVARCVIGRVAAARRQSEHKPTWRGHRECVEFDPYETWGG